MFNYLWLGSFSLKGVLDVGVAYTRELEKLMLISKADGNV